MASLTASAPTRRLTFFNKLAFGFGDIGAAIGAGVNGFYLNAFLLDVAGLRPGAVAIIFGIAQFWDAINDPIIGWLTDRTKTRWGRRRPWLLFGALPFALAFFLHWFVPPLDETMKFWYYLLIAILYRTAFTAVNVPYTAMTPELTDDYDERTQLNGFRFTFSILGGLIAIVAHPMLVGLGGDDVFRGHLISAGMWAFFIAISAWGCFAGTYEHPVSGKDKTPGNPFSEVWTVFQNRPFLMVTGIYLMSWLSLQLIQQFLQLYVRYWVQAEDNLPLYLLTLQVTAFVFLWVWGQVSKTIGKKRVYYIGITIWILTMVGLFFLGRGQADLIFVVSFFAGIGVSTAYLIPWSMLPDVVDYDEMVTGERREGTFYGLFALLQQVGISIGIAMGNLSLEGAGYVTPEVINNVVQTVEQPDSVLFVLCLIVSVVPAVVLLLSLPMAYYYPITRERHDEIRASLEGRA